MRLCRERQGLTLQDRVMIITQTIISGDCMDKMQTSTSVDRLIMQFAVGVFRAADKTLKKRLKRHHSLNK